MPKKRRGHLKSCSEDRKIEGKDHEEARVRASPLLEEAQRPLTKKPDAARIKSMGRELKAGVR